jgi:hypothetical protein
MVNSGCQRKNVICEAKFQQQHLSSVAAQHIVHVASVAYAASDISEHLEGYESTRSISSGDPICFVDKLLKALQYSQTFKRDTLYNWN